MTTETATAPSLDQDEQAGRSTDERVVTVSGGGDWDSVLDEASGAERVVVNMGPQHPATHGVLRLVLELEGETVASARLVIGYLHTGIEKNMEYRNWVQGVTYVTRMDYLAPTVNETAYCLAVEKLLGIEAPPRAQAIRVLCMELNRITSHLFSLSASALELAAVTGTTNALRERELALDLLEFITGLRMNHAYVRPGGVAQDLPAGTIERGRHLVRTLSQRFLQMDDLLTHNPVWKSRLEGIAVLDTQACLALGVTGPVLRSAGLAWDLRKTEPYCGYETYDFDIPTHTAGDAYSRFLLRKQELHESLRIIDQALDRLEEPGPVMVGDRKIAWPAQLALGSDGMGQSLEHVKHIMASSMEALIHHFKLVTEGFRVPAGQVYTAVESPRGELGVHAVSEGGTRPFRLHMRDPSFANIQALPAMCEGGMLSDVIAVLASLDPVLGGVDR